MKTLSHNSFFKMLHKPMACFMICCLLNGQLWAVTNPAVQTGPATIDPGSTPANTTVNVNGGSSVIHWDSMINNDGDHLNFNGGSGAVLNRVAQAVDFNGNLNAQGVRIYIVSPNGIHIGSTAKISAAEFIASGLNISTENFMNGVDKFEAFDIGNNMTQIGQVQNDTDPGNFNVAGRIALLGSKVLNKGTIVSTDGGLVLMATGETIMIGDDSDIVVEYPDDPPFSSTGGAFEIDNAEGVGVGDVSNKGTVTSMGGQIVLAAGDTFVQAIDGLDALSLELRDETEEKLQEVADRLDSLGISVESDGIQGEVHQEGLLTTGATSGTIAMSANEEVFIEAGSSTIADEIAISGTNIELSTSLSTNSDMTLLAYEDDVDTKLDAAVTTGQDLTVAAATAIHFGEKTESVNGDMILDAGTVITLSDDLQSGGSILLSTDTILPPGQAPIEGYTATSGNIDAQDDITIDTAIALSANNDQHIISEDGTVTAEGFILKPRPGYELTISGGGVNDNGVSVDLNGPFIQNQGNVYISGTGDIELPVGVTDAYISGAGNPDDYENAISESEGSPNFGGVSIISENGTIHTEGSTSIDNIKILGYSNDTIEGPGLGVDLPYLDGSGEAQGKAAIVLQSEGDLLISKSATLEAGGRYQATEIDPETGEVLLAGVDDRPGIDFLQGDGVVIGGYERNEGIPSDVAIYGASTSGNVDVESTPYMIYDEFFYYGRGDDGPYEVDFGTATVVFDAFDTVTLPFLQDLIDGSNGQEIFGSFRLEVSSRTTEWLSQAIANGTLPFADDTEAVTSLGLIEDYVLRGAGAEDNTRAWVLEDPDEENPGIPALAVLALPELKGCPVEMDAAAAELAMNSDDLQLLIGNSLASNPNIQPCKACQKLVTAASILNDADGTRMAAMNQIFNSLAPIDAPFTPEVSASVATAFANLSNDDPQYALANEYINAFVDYVAVLSEDLQVPVGDPVAFALEKHGEGVTTSENPNMAAYVMAQLQASGQSI